MAISLKHKFTSPKGDGSDTSLVRPSNWNDEHNLLLAAKKLFGRWDAADGPAQEVSLGDSLYWNGQYIETNNAGEVAYFARNTAPLGWLKANGAAISRTTYANLFAAIGTTFGIGDGSTTFTLPDFRGYFLRGWDDGRGIDASRTFGSSQPDGLGSHGHTISDPGHGHSISDPTHVHGVGDPGHAHGVADGGHAHNVPTKPSGSNGGNIVGGSVNSAAGVTNFASAASGTGIGIYGAGTGIYIGGAGTGIGIYGNTTGITIAAAGSTETRPKNYAALICIKY